MIPPQKPKPKFRTPRFFWILMCISVVLLCELDNIRVEIEKERELEEMKRHHIEETMKAYGEYARKWNEEQWKLYQDSIDSISAGNGVDSASSGNYR